LFVHRQGSIQKTRARATGSKPVNGCFGCLFDFWVRGQPQVVVGSAHDETFALVQDFGPFIFVQGDEVRVKPLLDGLLRRLELEALRKNIHDLTSNEEKWDYWP
jgi:hypothetical protein